MEIVAAIIVTYNRKELLSRSLQAVLDQTRPVDRIFIVDNASTDGTAEFLKSEGYVDHSPIEYLQLEHNTGGAGGFHTGMKRAYDEGYTWLWLMDDDGEPARDCLEHLLSVSHQLDVVGAAVLAAENRDNLAMRLHLVDEDGFFVPRQHLATYQDLEEHSRNGGIYRGVANFFNAVLIHRRVPQTVGFVIPDMFIWGDEHEYYLRIKSQGFRIGTYRDAIYTHPASLFKFTELKYYYYFRNIFYIYRKHAATMYRPVIRQLFPLYMFLVCLYRTPSWSPRYLAKVLKAVFQSWQGKLIPYQ